MYSWIHRLSLGSREKKIGLLERRSDRTPLPRDSCGLSPHSRTHPVRRDRDNAIYSLFAKNVKLTWAKSNISTSSCIRFRTRADLYQTPLPLHATCVFSLDFLLLEHYLLDQLFLQRAERTTNASCTLETYKSIPTKTL